MESHHDWYVAEIPETPPRILKIRLRPYTLGHEILLQRFKSPLVGHDPGPLPALAITYELVLACIICAQNYQSAMAALRNPLLSAFLFLWRLRLGRKVDWIAETAKFHEHRATGRWLPEICFDPKARELVAPEPIRMITTLLREFGIPWRDAYDFPIAKAHAWCAAVGDMEGTLDLIGSKEEALLAAADKRDKEGTW